MSLRPPVTCLTPPPADERTANHGLQTCDINSQCPHSPGNTNRWSSDLGGSVVTSHAGTIYRVALILVHWLLLMSSPGNSSLVLPEPTSHSRDTFPSCISKARKSTWTGQEAVRGRAQVTSWVGCNFLLRSHTLSQWRQRLKLGFL